MEHVEVLIIALFVSVLGLNALAERFSVPYPIFLVLGGLALGAVPGVPDVELEPELVLVIFLPPLRRLGVLDDGSEEESEELLGRLEAAQAALRWL
jgi:Kef-type K+ transport system membrane component KefB